MSFEFTVRVLAGYLRLDCTGSYSQEDAVAAFAQAFALAAEHDRDAVLMDTRALAPPEPTMMQRYDLAVHVAALQLRQPRRVRIALLGSEPIVHPQRFGEIVATNRGASARVFTDEQMAVDWLLARPKTG